MKPGERGVQAARQGDALPPEVLTDLIQTEIRQWCDVDLYEQKEKDQEEQRDQLMTVSSRWDEVVEMVS